MSSLVEEVLCESSTPLLAEATLAPAIQSIAETAQHMDDRAALETIYERLMVSTEDVVETAYAEQDYRDWLTSHAEHSVSDPGSGPALVDHLKATMESYNTPSMEAEVIQMMKRTFSALKLAMQTAGKSLNGIRTSLREHKDEIVSKPIVLDNVAHYRFLSRNDKPVTDISKGIDEDEKFIERCNEHYNTLYGECTDLSKRFRDACRADSDDAIRDAIDYMDDNLIDRSRLRDLAEFELLGNRKVSLNKNGFPVFEKPQWKWSLKGKRNELLADIAHKRIHGYIVGGPVKFLPGVEGMNAAAGAKAVSAQVKSSGGIFTVEDLLKALDRAERLYAQVGKFAQMAATMTERLRRMEADMDDAYNTVNTDKTNEENLVRLRELRFLKKSASRALAHRIYMGRSIAMIMEDHASYIHRNIVLLANSVIKK